MEGTTMQELARDEYSYKAERDHLDDAALCKCGSCGALARYDQLRPIGDCSLTPGDPSPAGRCADPSCDSLAYPDRPEDRAAEVGPDDMGGIGWRLPSAAGVEDFNRKHPPGGHGLPYGIPQAVAAGAGYRVERQPEGGFYVIRPNGEESHVALNTEREAWESAFADHERRHPRPGEFTRAIEAGYRVERDQDPPAGKPAGWRAFPPDGEELDASDDASGWPTERAAWEACDRHRTTGEG
jgi:hypothetical protein